MLQGTKVFPSESMAIAHTGKPDGLGNGIPAGLTLCLSEPSSRPIQVGNKGQETHQVDSGMDPKTQFEAKNNSILLIPTGRILEKQILAVAVEGLHHCPVHW